MWQACQAIFCSVSSVYVEISVHSIYTYRSKYSFVFATFCFLFSLLYWQSSPINDRFRVRFRITFSIEFLFYDLEEKFFIGLSPSYRLMLHIDNVVRKIVECIAMLTHGLLHLFKLRWRLQDSMIIFFSEFIMIVKQFGFLFNVNLWIIQAKKEIQGIWTVFGQITLRCILSYWISNWIFVLKSNSFQFNLNSHQKRTV